EDPAGAPVPGAKVYGDGDTTVSDASGAFRLAGVPAKSGATATVWADGFLMGQATFDVAGDVSDVRIVMKPAPRIRGTVRMADGGPLTAGAVVRTISLDHIPSHYPDEATAWRAARPVRVKDDDTFETALFVENGIVRVR